MACWDCDCYSLALFGHFQSAWYEIRIFVCHARSTFFSRRGGRTCLLDRLEVFGYGKLAREALVGWEGKQLGKSWSWVFTFCIQSQSLTIINNGISISSLCLHTVVIDTHADDSPTVWSDGS